MYRYQSSGKLLTFYTLALKPGPALFDMRMNVFGDFTFLSAVVLYSRLFLDGLVKVHGEVIGTTELVGYCTWF
ncbi:unnamed protein product [Chondrus crispus]|uniref:Uncharacterized protein n=1 Tax=Chondrus crispus TaxID=2769 RepID=R7QA87_CHOCR|nr:unnamed protein product [Chondrus crispus]CDF34693.1 unnamed protein product [Chondrus crispus]|eukprot:XP_005714512.1 unnamed protein product [Chondrus crispus]